MPVECAALLRDPEFDRIDLDQYLPAGAKDTG
jgi:hypothetical protein